MGTFSIRRAFQRQGALMFQDPVFFDLLANGLLVFPKRGRDRCFCGTVGNAGFNDAP